MNDLTIGVTTVAFSSDLHLVDRLKEQSRYNVLINEKRKRFSQNELIDFLKQCDGAIVGLDQINEEVLAECPRLKVLSKYGVGLDNIDFSACEKFNVHVTYPQGVNKRSVSEEVLGYMLSLARNIYVTSNRLKRNIWDKNGGWQLTGKTVGIIGVGHIGKDLIDLLKPFNCKILVNDIIDQTEYYKKHDLIESTKEDIYINSDFITIHTPLTSLTKNLFNNDAFSVMKSSAIVINTARGEIVNLKDLKAALIQGVIAGAALDVYDEEPPKDLELIKQENLICTPHIGGNAKEAVQAMGEAAIENLVKYFEG